MVLGILLIILVSGFGLSALMWLIMDFRRDHITAALVYGYGTVGLLAVVVGGIMGGVSLIEGAQ